MLALETSGRVRSIKLDRPQRRNALGTEIMRDLADAFRGADRDPEVNAVVLTASPPAFCAGSDLKELGGLSIPAMCDHEAATAAVARAIAGMAKPVVVAVEGFALGGGFILATSCDVVVTSSNTRWQLLEVANGWLPVWGLESLLARVGPIRGRLLTWGAEAIDGREAHRLGVADYVTGPGQADARALEIGQRLAALPAVAVASCKRFFEPFAAAQGERLDRLAAQHFAANCEHDAAKATLAKFTETKA